MSWFGFGSKKPAKKSKEDKYKEKLDQLEKLGYTDRAKNLQHLKLYAGDVNKVIQDYMLQKPSSSQSQSPNNNDKAKPKKEAPKEAVIKNLPKAEQPKAKPTPKESKPTQPKAKTTPSESKPKPTTKQRTQIPKVTMAKPIVKSAEEQKTTPPKTINLQNNLKNLISSDLRQLLLNIGEPMIGEIVFSNSINGQTLYDYGCVNPLLKKFNVSFPDNSSYQSLIQQMEKCYQVCTNFQGKF